MRTSTTGRQRRLAGCRPHRQLVSRQRDENTIAGKDQEWPLGRTGWGVRAAAGYRPLPSAGCWFGPRCRIFQPETRYLGDNYLRYPCDGIATQADVAPAFLVLLLGKSNTVGLGQSGCFRTVQISAYGASRPWRWRRKLCGPPSRKRAVKFNGWDAHIPPGSCGSLLLYPMLYHRTKIMKVTLFYHLQP